MSDARKRYAVLVGQADESYQERFMRGFLRSAFANNADVCVFSMYVKYQDTAEREQGDSNIYSLMQPEAFDGVAMLKDSIQTANVPEKLEKWLSEEFKGPVLIVEKESGLFPYEITGSYQAMYNVVAHMIEKHGYSDIAFLSGKKWHEHSQERLKAYRDCIEKHGLVVNEDRIFYGDFWYQMTLFGKSVTYFPTRPQSRARVMASSSTTSARDSLTMRTPIFILAKASSLNMLWVCSL